MPLTAPPLSLSDGLAIKDAKLDAWYAKNADALYALTLSLYYDLYSYQKYVLRAVPSGTIEEGLRLFLNAYFSVGTPSVGTAKCNGYSKGLQEHFLDIKITKNFNWQMYWAGLYPNQSGIDKLLEVFYNYMIGDAVSRGIDNDLSNSVKFGRAERLVDEVNSLIKPLVRV
jgi:hypothetical protein